MNPATTIDHVPARTVFRERKWPEGFIFPACADCNDLSRDAELLLGLLGRIYPDAAEEKHQKELEKLMSAVNNRFPGLLPGMRLSRAREKRELRERGATASDVGVLSVEDDRFEKAAQLFGAKLMMALFYRHTGFALPRSGGIPFRWFTNAQNLDDMLPRDVLAPLLGGFAELKRENTSLQDQFFYRFAVADNKRAAAFLAFFNQAIVMLGFVFDDIVNVKVPERAVVLRPHEADRP